MDKTASAERPLIERSAGPARSAGRLLWARWCLLATALAVLASHLFYVLGLMRAGVVWTDGARAFGVDGASFSDILPPGPAVVLSTVSVLAVLFGVPVMAGVAAAAALAMSRARRRRRDVLSITTLVVVVLFFVLLGVWGDELWPWILD